MRRIYTLLFTLSVAFVLTGCGPDPSAQLEQDSAAIIRQAIVVKLNEEIANNYGNQSFLLAPGKLLLVSPGVNQAVNLAGQETFKPLEIISAARRYGATKVICNPVGLSSSRIRKKKNNDYPYQVKLTISVDVTYEMYENFSGVPVHAVTPPDWAAWSSEKKTEFIQELYSKLAPAEFDYQKIAEESSGNSEVIRDNWSFDAVWNQSRGHWELEGDQKLEVDAPAPTWPSARESAAALRRHFESENLVAYQGTYFSADDVELAKKKSNENPVYYAQYAHARMCSIQKQAQDLTVADHFDRLDHEKEIELMKGLQEFNKVIIESARTRQVHKVCHYIQDLASRFHSFYNACKVIDPQDPDLSSQRLALVKATQIVLANALDCIGVEAVESM